MPCSWSPGASWPLLAVAITVVIGAVLLLILSSGHLATTLFGPG